MPLFSPRALCAALSSMPSVKTAMSPWNSSSTRADFLNASKKSTTLSCGCESPPAIASVVGEPRPREPPEGAGDPRPAAAAAATSAAASSSSPPLSPPPNAASESVPSGWPSVLVLGREIVQS